MTENAHITILRRMAGQLAGPPPPSPLTTSRAVRLALVKAAVDAGGLVLRVASTGDDLGRLDDLLAGLDPGLMLVGVRRSGQLCGLIAVDMQLRAAMLETQTTGRLLDQSAEPRAPTATDKALCDPLLGGFLAALPPAVAGTGYDGWVDDLVLGDSLADTRIAGLLLDDGDYRILRMNVDLGQGDRQGALILLLPVQTVAAAVVVADPPITGPDWAQAFADVVNTAPAMLTARLHRFALPLGEVRQLQVGQILPLPGCTVQSVRLIAPDGRVVGQAKLGQLGGYRALRVEDAPAPVLQDLANTQADDPVAWPMVSVAEAPEM
jgi:flagellar motor switch protein FliM